jgi:hypothetical protein
MMRMSMKLHEDESDRLCEPQQVTLLLRFVVETRCLTLAKHDRRHIGKQRFRRATFPTETTRPHTSGHLYHKKTTSTTIVISLVQDKETIEPRVSGVTCAYPSGTPSR